MVCTEMLKTVCAAVVAVFSAGVLCAGAPMPVTLRTEAALPLSQAQEAEGCIDRACRWLASQPMPKDRALQLVRRYALTPPDGLFQVAPCDRTPLEELLSDTARRYAEAAQAARDAAKTVFDKKNAAAEAPPAFVWTFGDALAFAATQPARLFAFQAALTPDAETPADWRLQIALALIASQKIDAQGGHWGDAASTVWGILTLRSMLGRSAGILYITPCPMPMPRPAKAEK